MKQIWAPWRMEYITDATGEKDKGCTFCKVFDDTEDRKNLILHRGKDMFVILNKYPYNNGHLMVVPNRHTDDFTTFSEQESKEMHQLVHHSIKALNDFFHPQGFNLGMNLGYAAGAGIKYHLHEHIVPRWVGDTNFMPVVGVTKSMPQHLMESYDQLFEYFRRL